MSVCLPSLLRSDTCRWISPAFFKRKNGQSAVLAQPQTEDERKEAFQALLSCPT